MQLGAPVERAGIEKPRLLVLAREKPASARKFPIFLAFKGTRGSSYEAVRRAGVATLAGARKAVARNPRRDCNRVSETLITTAPRPANLQKCGDRAAVPRIEQLAKGNTSEPFLTGISLKCAQ